MHFAYENTEIKDAFFEIIPCPYEETTTFGKGTANGPAAIIEASQELEFYDDEYGIDASESHGIKTLEPVKMPLQDASTEQPFQALEKVCSRAYVNKKFPIVLGGEHSLSLGAVLAAHRYAESQNKKLKILHFDAHADLRQEYEGNPHNHACAIYQMLKHCPGLEVVSVGIRNISRGEVSWLKEEPRDDIARPKIFYARDEKNKSLNGNSWDEKTVLDALGDNAETLFYISFDLDGFDSSLMPSTGTPEPGGLEWYTATNIIREACKKFTLIGADVVELAPISQLHAPDFLAAKLVYKIISTKVMQMGHWA